MCPVTLKIVMISLAMMIPSQEVPQIGKGRESGREFHEFLTLKYCL
jgi:hypothetical protein